MVQRVVYQEFQANRGYFDTLKKRKENFRNTKRSFNIGYFLEHNIDLKWHKCASFSPFDFE